MALRILLSGLFIMFFISPQNAQNIWVGDIAPAITIQEWIKGDPVTELKKDNVYVVEFSSVNCPPCRKAIPHLSELARQYKGQVSVISIYTMESNKNDPRDLEYIISVKKLVATLQNKIDFAVAVDVPQQTTMDAWKIEGTPTVFLIDRSGHIVWKGDNSKVLDALIPQVLNNTLDASVVMKRQEEFDKTIRYAFRLKENGKYVKSVEILDSLIKARPEYKATLYYCKFKVLAGDDDTKAYELLRWMLDEPMEGFVWDKFVAETWQYAKKPDYDLALLTADRAIKEAETDEVVAKVLNYKAAILRRKYADNKAGKYLGDAVNFMELAVEKSKLTRDTAFIEDIQNSFYYYKFFFLATTDDKKANDYLRWVFRNNPKGISWFLFIDEALSVQKKPDYNLLLAITNRMVKDAEVNPPSYLILPLSRKAKVLATKGDVEKAIELYEQALTLSKTVGDRYSVDGFEKRLEELKNKIIKVSPGKTTKLNGNLTGLDKANLVLQYQLTDLTIVTDTIRLKNGHFTYTGYFPLPQLASIIYADDKPAISFYLEKGNIEILGNINLPNQITIAGTKTNIEYNLYKRLKAPIYERQNGLDEKFTKASAEKNEDAKRIIKEEYKELGVKSQELTEIYIKDHPKSFVSLDVLRGIVYKLSYEEFDQLFSGLDILIKQSVPGKSVAEHLGIIRKTQPGQPAIDFSQPDVNNKKISLSSYKGKYVLLDFWASSCYPCRVENPNLVNMYNLYKNKSFEIVGVSYDSDVNAWKNAIEKDGLLWTNLNDLKGLQNEVIKLYGVTSFPTNYLINPDGIIIAKNLRGIELQKELKKIFEEN